eukprot:TRINITY_DN6588_c0_g1_i1.p1 TRINITY_DN6588_c0_g1~~TRINITY_DN6588_c0_g1_i1.p1  ORF type:complete len:387 (+),score=119.15 TRINITY_DN6588_c0_g1_i1:81-1241(+)
MGHYWETHQKLPSSIRSGGETPVSMPSLGETGDVYGLSGMSGHSMPSLVHASSSSERETGSRREPRINRERRKTATGQTIVTTPWYPQGVLKDEIVLGEEVQALSKLLTLTDEEKTARNICRSTLQEIVRQFWPEGTVKVYGSFAVDMSLPTSALDLVCEGCADLSTSFTGFVDTLKRMQFAVDGTFFSGGEAFVRVTHSACGVVANVSFVGTKSLARTSVKQVRKYVAQFPGVPAVFSTVRLILQQSKCNDAKDGLSSYALLVMIFSVCHSCPQPADPGTLLLHFFRHFSPTETRVASAAGGPGRLDAATRKTLEPGTLWVEDPLDAGNNLARDCRRLPQIRSVFHTSTLTLEKWLSEKWSGYRGRTPLSSILAYGELWERAGDK